LQREFGSRRAFNSPLAEAGIVGRAIGYGHARVEAGGRDPILRLYLAAMMQLRDELATLRWRSYNGFACPR